MRALRRFFARPANVLAAVILGLFLYMALAAPWLAPPRDPAHPDPLKVVGDPHDPVPRPPDRASPLGTVPGQLDVYHSLVWGARSALIFGLAVALPAAVIGVVIGAVSGYAGSLVNAALMRLSDAVTSIPILAGVWLFQQLVLPISFQQVQDFYGIEPTPLQAVAFKLELSPLMVGLILFSWMPYARLVNASVILLKQSDFVVAARAVGMGGIDILRRHLLPNAITPAIVLLARDLGGMVVLAAAFTFVGIEGGTEWGMLLVVSRSWILGPGGNPLRYWWVYVPAAALTLFGAGWNLLGDGLNEALNPRHNQA